MKIAIQGHPTRGKEIIQILESLGGINLLNLFGSATYRYYYICDDNIIRNTFYDTYYKIYTLEEFEKEFPFKIGDKVVHSHTPNFIGTVVDIKFDDHIPYRVSIGEKICTCGTMSLKPYKEMKEERNITLTLDKAKEWYKKGGELKEVALQAYSEKELTEVKLPKTWEEFCDNHPKQEYETYIGIFSTIELYGSISDRHYIQDKNLCPSEKSAEAHIALIQLEQLRDCYRQGNIPQEFKYKIRKVKNKYTIVYGQEDSFLSFCDRQTSEEFLECFRDLIEKAGDLI